MSKNKGKDKKDNNKPYSYVEKSPGMAWLQSQENSNSKVVDNS